MQRITLFVITIIILLTLTTSLYPKDKSDKAIDLLIGLIPNSDGFLGGKADFFFNYPGSIIRSGVFYNSHSFYRLIEEQDGLIRTTRTYSEKVYGVNLVGIQDKQVKLFNLFYFSGDLGLSYHIVEETFDMKDFTDPTVREFSTEIRDSDFLEPRINVSLLFPFSNNFNTRLYSYLIPIGKRTTKGRIEYSTLSLPFESDSEDLTVDLLVGLEFMIDFSKDFSLMLGCDYRRQAGTYLSVKQSAAGSLTFDDFDYIDESIIPTIGFGLGFVQKFFSGVKPMITVSYFINKREIIGTVPSLDRTDKKEQWMFGFLMKF